MDAELKTKWVEALRSGEYTQASGKLRDDATNGYCCLGVLCDLIDPDAWEFDSDAYGGRWLWVDESGTQTALYLTYDIESQFFDPTHKVDTGIAKHTYEGNIWAEESRAGAILNDSGKSFEEIADFIEESL